MWASTALQEVSRRKQKRRAYTNNASQDLRGTDLSYHLGVGGGDGEGEGGLGVGGGGGGGSGVGTESGRSGCLLQA